MCLVAPGICDDVASLLLFAVVVRCHMRAWGWCHDQPGGGTMGTVPQHPTSAQPKQLWHIDNTLAYNFLQMLDLQVTSTWIES